MQIKQKTLDSFHKAALSLKLYSRAELSDEKNRSLIEKLYVDPLPNEQVFKTLLADNSTFLIGRKGTGKSTIFLRVQHELRKNKLGAISAYMDIRNVYEASQVDPASLEKVEGLSVALSPTEIQRFLLLKRFFKSLLSDIGNELKIQVEHSFLTKLKENLIGSSKEVFERLDAIIERLDNPNYEDIASYIISQRKENLGAARGITGKIGGSLTTDITGFSASTEAKVSGNASHSEAYQEEYSQIFMRIIQIPDVINELKAVLKSIGMRKLYIFLDDFSELPSDAMTAVVDSLVSPLARWSDFVKFKIAAYPGRIYLGTLDKTKIEEVHLDIYDLYGGSGVAQMEEKATDFIKRIVDKRFSVFRIEAIEILGRTNQDDMYRNLFYASIGVVAEV